LKYITTLNEESEREIFTFPNSVNHDCMAEALSCIKDQTHNPWERVSRTPVSAGFVSAANECYGESESLGLESLGHADSSLLNDQLMQANH
jgi:hypothetical protein